MRIFKGEESVRIVRDSEVFLVFVTPDGEDTATNILEWRKIM